jgi:probable HAF family extracellular repeat protein
MTDLGALGDPATALWRNSYARGISSDGTVVFGDSNNGIANHAFKYVAGAMIDLGALGNPATMANRVSSATGCSADGSVIVGNSNNGSASHAYKYVNGAMIDLGALGDPSTAASRASNAIGVSADGSVVVGSSRGAITTHAFRYADGVMTDLGALGNPATAASRLSQARGVSADGSVVVGNSNNGFASHGFKYAGGIMTDLGALGDQQTAASRTSFAVGVSADGSTIFGYSNNGAVNHAFKYVDGQMTDLGALGDPATAASRVSEAYGASADGSVIVGESFNGTVTHAFLYREFVMLDTVVWMASIKGPAGVLPSVAAMTTQPLEGAHHRILMSYDPMDKPGQAWVTGDFGARDVNANSHTSSGEVGVSRALGDAVIGLGAGYGEQNSDLLYGGSSHLVGQYLVGEADHRLPHGLGIASLTAMLGSWRSEILRAYATGSGTDFSQGSTSIRSSQIRLRYDSPMRRITEGLSLNLFASFCWGWQNVDAYRENGGSYDAMFDAQKHASGEARLGLTTRSSLSPSTSLITTVEWIRRFDRQHPDLTGVDVDHGDLPFVLAGSRITPDQGRLGLDIDHKLTAETLLSLSLHFSSAGETSDFAAALSLRRAF